MNTMTAGLNVAFPSGNPVNPTVQTATILQKYVKCAHGAPDTNVGAGSMKNKVTGWNPNPRSIQHTPPHMISLFGGANRKR